MKNLAFRLLSITALCLGFTSFAQTHFQGIATYQTKTTIDMERFGDRMPPERQKMIMERLKNNLEKTYTLKFNKEASIYKEDEKLDAPSASGRGFRMMMSGQSGSTYKNIKTNLLKQDRELFGKAFLISDTLKSHAWKLTGETKKIGNYTCMKATTTKTLNTPGFFRRGPRKRSDDTKKETKKDSITPPKTIEVTAWYTMEIPVNQGPGEYWGLPGLILEINEGRTTILCSKIVINPKEKAEIKEPTKGKIVTKQEYDLILKEKTKEMRERFRGGRGKRGGKR